MAGNPGLVSALALMLACGLLAAPHASAPTHGSKTRFGGSKANSSTSRSASGASRSHSGIWRSRFRVPRARSGVSRARSGLPRAYRGTARARPAVSTARLRTARTGFSPDGTALRFGLASAETSSEAVRTERGSRGRFSVRVNVRNLNDGPVTVFGVGRNGPGLRLLSSRRPIPHSLPPEQATGFDLRYEVTDCRAVPRGDWPIPIRLEQDGAPALAYASMRMVPAKRTGSAGEASGASWQDVLSGEICAPRRDR
ncbi:hypothetical protein [Streptosporangium sp. NPDC051022]|uniref:hypothetical protein n=1 Tax=Streptosporangium sp. NPDC051022 TaxID=3155752 RepID=UPI003421B7BD